MHFEYFPESESNPQNWANREANALHLLFKNEAWQSFFPQGQEIDFVHPHQKRVNITLTTIGWDGVDLIKK